MKKVFFVLTLSYACAHSLLFAGEPFIRMGGEGMFRTNTPRTADNPNGLWLPYDGGHLEQPPRITIESPDERVLQENEARRLAQEVHETYLNGVRSGRISPRSSSSTPPARRSVASSPAEDLDDEGIALSPSVARPKNEREEKAIAEIARRPRRLDEQVFADTPPERMTQEELNSAIAGYKQILKSKFYTDHIKPEDLEALNLSLDLTPLDGNEIEYMESVMRAAQRLVKQGMEEEAR